MGPRRLSVTAIAVGVVFTESQCSTWDKLLYGRPDGDDKFTNRDWNDHFYSMMLVVRNYNYIFSVILNRDQLLFVASVRDQ